MINDIKLDKLTITDSPRIRHDEQKTPVSAKTDGIVIGGHLDKMVAYLVSDEELPGEAERVQAMKSRVETNNYRVDVDALSDKLVHHLFDGI